MWLVNAVQPLCQSVVGEVLHLLGGGVVMVVSTLTVVTEAVCVFHSQVKALQRVERAHANLVTQATPTFSRVTPTFAEPI